MKLTLATLGKGKGIVVAVRACFEIIKDGLLIGITTGCYRLLLVTLGLSVSVSPGLSVSLSLPVSVSLSLPGGLFICLYILRGLRGFYREPKNFQNLRPPIG